MRTVYISRFRAENWRYLCSELRNVYISRFRAENWRYLGSELRTGDI